MPPKGGGAASKAKKAAGALKSGSGRKASRIHTKTHFFKPRTLKKARNPNEVTARNIDSNVFHWTKDQIPSQIIARNEVEYMPNGWRNVYGQRSRRDVAERNMNPHVFDYIHEDPVVSSATYGAFRPDEAYDYNGGSNW
jgi:hypothetical protein